MSEKIITFCNVCGKQAEDEKQQRRENWISLKGTLNVWLEKPRAKTENYMHSICWKDHNGDFCSVACLVKALKAKESLP